MKKKILILLVISSFYLLNSCTEFKRAVSNQKKPAGDEFLVEKKEPLTMPPEFNKLPVPLSEEEANLDDSLEEASIENIIKEILQTENQNETNISKDLETSILEKIN